LLWSSEEFEENKVCDLRSFGRLGHVTLAKKYTVIFAGLIR